MYFWKANSMLNIKNTDELFILQKFPVILSNARIWSWVSKDFCFYVCFCCREWKYDLRALIAIALDKSTSDYLKNCWAAYLENILFKE